MGTTLASGFSHSLSCDTQILPLPQYFIVVICVCWDARFLAFLHTISKRRYNNNLHNFGDVFREWLYFTYQSCRCDIKEKEIRPHLCIGSGIINLVPGTERDD